MSSNPVSDAAADYTRRGFAVCRLLPGEKRPNYKGWTRCSLAPGDFRPKDNIGILTGRLSGDLVCVDLDDAEVLQQAERFLPPTGMVDGRPSKPRSHRWYRVTDIPRELTSTKASGGIGGPCLKHFRQSGTNRNLIDFLGTGGQAAVPPSLHYTGEYRSWDENGEPAQLPMRELWTAVCDLAQAGGWNPSKSTYEQKRQSMAFTDFYRSPVLSLPERIKQAEDYVENAPLAKSGHGGDQTTFEVARRLRRDFELPDEDSRRLLGRYNERLKREGEKTWSEGELDHKWESAARPALSVFPPEAIGEGTANDPHRLARTFLNQNTWIYWNNLYWEYDEKRYVEVPEHEATARLMEHVKACLDADYVEQVACYQEQLSHLGRRPPRMPVPLSANRSLVKNTLLAIGGMTLQPSAVQMPCLLPENKQLNWLALANGLLDLQSGMLHPHTPDWFSTVCLPYDYSSTAESPKWLQVLNQNLEGDAERIALLQEFFGYCLNNTTDAQACLVLVGEGGNGKSVVLAGLHAMLGEKNVSTVPLEDFGKRFAMAQTLGKLANVCAEVGELDKTAEGTLKAFVSGDRMTFERKGKDPFSARPTARLVLSTNNVPRFADRSEGIWRRLLLLPFDRRVTEAERVYGMDKPEWWLQAGEVPGILNWALEGWRRLKAAEMRFTSPAVCRLALEAHQRESDPCRTFLLEHFVADPKARPLQASVVYQEYRNWCEENGHKYPLNAQAFGKQVRRVFAQVESRSQRFDGTPHRAWLGLSHRVA